MGAKPKAEERLHKLISKVGFTSRRKAEALIRAGRVTVNGEVAQIGQKATLVDDRICIDGESLSTSIEPCYIRLYKPTGVITSITDDRGRPVVTDLIDENQHRVYPVGRLDYESEGLLLLTNNGDLTYRLTHPSFNVPRTYHVKVKGQPSKQSLNQLLKGIRLQDGLAQALHVERLRMTTGGHTWIEIILTEGRNHEVRRMCDAIRHPVLRLKRVRYANLHIDDLKPGESCHLTQTELHDLFSYVSMC